MYRYSVTFLQKCVKGRVMITFAFRLIICSGIMEINLAIFYFSGTTSFLVRLTDCNSWTITLSFIKMSVEFSFLSVRIRFM